MFGALHAARSPLAVLGKLRPGMVLTAEILNAIATLASREVTGPGVRRHPGGWYVRELPRATPDTRKRVSFRGFASEPPLTMNVLSCQDLDANGDPTGDPFHVTVDSFDEPGGVAVGEMDLSHDTMPTMDVGWKLWVETRAGVPHCISTAFYRYCVD